MASRLPLAPPITESDGEGMATFGDGLRSLAFNLNRLGSLASGLLLQHERQLVHGTRKVSYDRRDRSEWSQNGDDTGGQRRLKSALKHKSPDSVEVFRDSISEEANNAFEDEAREKQSTVSKPSPSVILPRTFTQAKTSGKKVSLKPSDVAEAKGGRDASLILPRSFDSCKKSPSPASKHVSVFESIIDGRTEDEPQEKCLQGSELLHGSIDKSPCATRENDSDLSTWTASDSLDKQARGWQAVQRARLLANSAKSFSHAKNKAPAPPIPSSANSADVDEDAKKEPTLDKDTEIVKMAHMMEDDDTATVRRPFMLMLQKPGGSNDAIVPLTRDVNGFEDDLKDSQETDDAQELSPLRHDGSLDGSIDCFAASHSVSSAMHHKVTLIGTLSRQDTQGSADEDAWTEIKLRDEWLDTPSTTNSGKVMTKRSVGLLRFNITVLDTPAEKYLSTTGQGTRMSKVARANSRSIMPNNIKFSILQAPISMMLQTSRKRTFLLHPLGWPKIVWCFLCVLLISYDVIMIPMQVFPLPTSGLFETLDWICSLFWTLDVLVNFRSGYFIGNKVEMNPASIALRYAQTWLAVDLSVVSLEWVGRFVEEDASTSESGSILKFSRFVRSLRVIRLLRLMKLPILFQLVEDQFHSPLVHLFFWLVKMTIGLLVVIHYITCGWYTIGDLSNPGWTDYAVTPPCGANAPDDIELSRAEELAARSAMIWYVDSARWVLSQVNGRTDMDTRRNLVEMGYTCLVAVSGPLLCMSIFGSLITSTMMELSETAAGRKQQMLLLNQYLHNHKVTAELTQLMKMHIRKKKEDDDADHEEAVLALLPKTLQSELLLEVRQPHIVEHHFFSILERHYPRALRHVVIQSLTSLLVQPNDRVFEKGDACTRMLFAYKGSFLYAQREAKKKDLLTKIATVTDLGGTDTWATEIQRSAEVAYTSGSDEAKDKDETSGSKNLSRSVWICEAALWLEWHHLGRLSACTSGALMAMELKTFTEALRNYSNAIPLVCTYATEFAEKLKKHGRLSDIIDLKMVYNGHSIYRGTQRL